MSPDGSVKPPPEEKLLRLIRGKGAKPQAESAAAAGSVAIVMVASDARQRLKRPAWSQVAVAVLGAAVGVEMLWVVWQAAWPLPQVEMPPVGMEPGNEAVSGPDEAAATVPDMPSLAASARESLFSPASAAGAAAGFAPPSSSATLLASRLTLMGIVAGDPAQAIIEDAQTQKTYFVTAGQAVVEGAVLEQVLDNHVVLNLGGEKIELTL